MHPPLGNRRRTTAKATTTTEIEALVNAKEKTKLRCHVSSICETTVAPIRALTVERTANVPQTRKGQHTPYGAQNRKLLLVDNIPQQPRAKSYSSVVDGIIQVNATLVKSADTKIRTLTSIVPGEATISKWNRWGKEKAKEIERKAGNLRRAKEAERGKQASDHDVGRRGVAGFLPPLDRTDAFSPASFQGGCFDDSSLLHGKFSITTTTLTL